MSLVRKKRLFTLNLENLLCTFTAKADGSGDNCYEYSWEKSTIWRKKLKIVCLYMKYVHVVVDFREAKNFRIHLWLSRLKLSVNFRFCWRKRLGSLYCQKPPFGQPWTENFRFLRNRVNTRSVRFGTFWII
jgi:hypothetical protein